VLQPRKLQFSTSTNTCSWSIKSDCVTTEMIGRNINNSIANAVGRKNQKNVRCFTALS